LVHLPEAGNTLLATALVQMLGERKHVRVPKFFATFQIRRAFENDPDVVW
jgi:hypothetical protein